MISSASLTFSSKERSVTSEPVFLRTKKKKIYGSPKKTKKITGFSQCILKQKKRDACSTRRQKKTNAISVESRKIQRSLSLSFSFSLKLSIHTSDHRPWNPSEKKKKYQNFPSAYTPCNCRCKTTKKKATSIVRKASCFAKTNVLSCDSYTRILYLHMQSAEREVSGPRIGISLSKDVDNGILDATTSLFSRLYNFNDDGLSSASD